MSKTGREHLAIVKALAAAWLIVWLAGCPGQPKVEILSARGTRRAMVQVEVATTPAARETGLMYRQSLAPNRGMLFIFPQPQHLTFWMKNTEIPLDMIFADSARRVVGIIANAEPFSERLLSVDSNSEYVLEVNGGFARAHQIEPGDTLRLMDLPKPRAE